MTYTTADVFVSSARLTEEYVESIQQSSMAKPRFQTLPTNCIGRVGIAKQTITDYIFPTLKPSEFERIFSVRMSKPYYIFNPKAFNLRRELGKDAYNHTIKELTKIESEANSKRSMIISILLQNPYLPYSRKLPSFYLISNLDYFLSLIDRGYVFFFVVVVLIYVGIACLGIIGILLDIVLCRVRKEPSEREIEWVRNELSLHPDLDTTAIDDVVYDSIAALSKDISQRFEKNVQPWTGVENIVIEMGTAIKQQFEQDEFMLLFNVDDVVDAEVQIASAEDVA